MARATPMLSGLALALVGAGGVSASSCNNGCFNTCARALRFATTGPDSASRVADCSSFVAVTVTPSAS